MAANSHPKNSKQIPTPRTTTTRQPQNADCVLIWPTLQQQTKTQKKKNPEIPSTTPSPKMEKLCPNSTHKESLPTTTISLPKKKTIPQTQLQYQKTHTKTNIRFSNQKIRDEDFCLKKGFQNQHQNSTCPHAKMPMFQKKTSKNHMANSNDKS